MLLLGRVQAQLRRVQLRRYVKSSDDTVTEDFCLGLIGKASAHRRAAAFIVTVRELQL